jgi:hypothetical protein
LVSLEKYAEATWAATARRCVNWIKEDLTLKPTEAQWLKSAGDLKSTVLMV